MNKFSEINIDRLSWFIITVVSLMSISAVLTSYKSSLQDFDIDPSVTLRQKETPKGLAWVEFDFGNGKRRKFEVLVGPYSYPLSQIFQGVDREGKFKIMVDSKGKIIVDEVRKYEGLWVIKRNGKGVEENPQNLTIKEGDQYRIEYEG